MDWRRDTVRDETTKKEIDKVQGTWKLVIVEINGEQQKGDGQQELVITKDKILIETPDGGEEVLYKLDPTKQLRPIDIIHTGKQDPERKGTMLGIYLLEGDKLTICTNAIGSEPRPTAFETKPKDGLTLLVYKRNKR